MITEVINQYASTFSWLHESQAGGFISELVGHARVDESTYQDEEDKQTISRVPVAIRSLPSDSAKIPQSQDPFGVLYLVPDRSKRCIVFFESSPFQSFQSESYLTGFNGQISLLCWYNSLGFNNRYDTLQSTILARFLNELKEHRPFPNSPLDYVINGPFRVIENDPTIFQNYTFYDSTSAYFAEPYGSFRIDFSLKLTLNESCAHSLVPVDIPDCA